MLSITHWMKSMWCIKAGSITPHTLHLLCVPSLPVSSALGKLSLFSTAISLWPGLRYRPALPDLLCVHLPEPTLGCSFWENTLHLHHTTRHPCPKHSLKAHIHVMTTSHWVCVYDIEQWCTAYWALKMQPKMSLIPDSILLFFRLQQVTADNQDVASSSEKQAHGPEWPASQEHCDS